MLRLRNPVKYTAKKLARLVHVSPEYIEQTVPAPPFNAAYLATLQVKLNKKIISPQEKERRQKRIQEWLEQQKANIPKFKVMNTPLIFFSSHLNKERIFRSLSKHMNHSHNHTNTQNRIHQLHHFK
jgi:hypothetical protein